MNVGKLKTTDLDGFLEASKTRTKEVTLLGVKIFVPKARMTKGNSKLVNILIFDVPAVKTCLNCSSCASTCYALKAQIQYKNTRTFREVNLELFKNDRTWLKQNIIDSLSRTKLTTVRLHSSGDFFSQDYIDFWSDIIALFPKINFYAYTKVEKVLNFDNIQSHKNFNLILSFVDGNLNYGSREYCEGLKDKYNSFICPASGAKDSTTLCGRECTYCVTQKNVVFPIH